MEKLILTPISPAALVAQIAEAVAAKLSNGSATTEAPAGDNPIDDYIPKKDVRGKLASSSTLWKLENEGKLTSYGIGGKRYYKKTDLAKLFTPIK